jgi:hypothetical protein
MFVFLAWAVEFIEERASARAGDLLFFREFLKLVVFPPSFYLFTNSCVAVLRMSGIEIKGHT